MKFEDYLDGTDKLPGPVLSILAAPLVAVIVIWAVPVAAIGWVYDWLVYKYQDRHITKSGYFLRDDRPIREGVPEFRHREEAYSLFCRNPYGRKAVYAGPRRWAVEQAYEHIVGLTTPGAVL